MKIPFEMVQAALRARMQSIASEGGKARANKLSPERRSEIARLGAIASNKVRWGNRKKKVSTKG